MFGTQDNMIDLESETLDAETSYEVTAMIQKRNASKLDLGGADGGDSLAGIFWI